MVTHWSEFVTLEVQSSVITVVELEGKTRNRRGTAQEMIDPVAESSTKCWSDMRLVIEFHITEDESHD